MEVDDLIIHKLPEWANWLAQDDDGVWYIYLHMPIRSTFSNVWTNSVTGIEWGKVCKTTPIDNNTKLIFDIKRNTWISI